MVDNWAHIRNLRMQIARIVIAEGIKIDDGYTIEEIYRKFFFRKIDIEKYVEFFFEEKDELYCFSMTEKEKIRKIISKHNEAMNEDYSFEENEENISQLESIRACFSSGWREEFKKFYDGIKSKIEMIHWRLLPIYKENYIMDRGIELDEDTLEYYDDIFTIYDLLNWYNINDSWVPSLKGDCNLNKEMSVKIYSRRWGHDDVYHIRRTTSGWEISSMVALGLSLEDDGVERFCNLLKHDNIFFPEDGVKNALHILWRMADEDEMSVDELKNKLQEIADWVSNIEKAVGQYQPDWCRYY